jgi:cytochrome c-type biogenesis protein CcmH/NrfF
MSLWRNSVLIAFIAVNCFAQSAADLEADSVKRVAKRLACQCGSCKESTACEMPGGCGYCKRVKTEISQLQTKGQSDQQIIAQLVKENGQDTFLAEPGMFGWMTPYLAILGGLGLIFWFVRRHLKTAAPAVNAEVVNRYNARIEKELETLE